MTATIATIAEIELRSISAIVVAAIAELLSSAEIVAIIWKPDYMCLK